MRDENVQDGRHSGLEGPEWKQETQELVLEEQWTVQVQYLMSQRWAGRIYEAETGQY